MKPGKSMGNLTRGIGGCRRLTATLQPGVPLPTTRASPCRVGMWLVPSSSKALLIDLRDGGCSPEELVLVH
jgi:hypothetical protein